MSEMPEKSEPERLWAAFGSIDGVCLASDEPVDGCASYVRDDIATRNELRALRERDEALSTIARLTRERDEARAKANAWRAAFEAVTYEDNTGVHVSYYEYFNLTNLVEVARARAVSERGE